MAADISLDLGQSAIDLGIVVTNSDTALGFYRDLLGMDHEGDIPMPIGGGGTMHRLRCGQSMIKLVCFDTTPDARPASGGIPDGTGFRYFTIHLNDIAAMMDRLEASGVAVVVPTTEIRPGVTIGMVNDPDGNIVEFVNYA